MIGRLVFHITNFQYVFFKHIELYIKNDIIYNQLHNNVKAALAFNKII